MTVEMKTGKRRLIEYSLSPLMRFKHERAVILCSIILNEASILAIFFWRSVMKINVLAVEKNANKSDDRSRRVFFLFGKPEIFFLFFVSLLSLNSCNSEGSSEELVASKDAMTNKAFDDFRSKVMSEIGVTVLSYSEDFARRVGLQVLEESQDSSAGLQALELRVEGNDAYAALPYSCVLRLYADSNQVIDFPEGNMSGYVTAFSEKNFFIRRHFDDGRLSVEDAIYVEEKRAEYRGKAHLVLRRKTGEFIHRRSIGYIEYYSEILPGLDYSKFSLGCANFRVFSDITEESEVEIWLKKESTESYFETLSELNERDYVVYKINVDFVRRAASVLRHTYEIYIQ